MQQPCHRGCCCCCCWQVVDAALLALLPAEELLLQSRPAAVLLTCRLQLRSVIAQKEVQAPSAAVLTTFYMMNVDCRQPLPSHNLSSCQHKCKQQQQQKKDSAWPGWHNRRRCKRCWWVRAYGILIALSFLASGDAARIAEKLIDLVGVLLFAMALFERGT